MTLAPDHWPRLKVVFADARALPARLRAAYLAEACSGNEALRHEVESLLASDAGAESFLETPAALLADTVAKRLEGQRIGPYQIASRIGAGGMGEVYRARDTNLGREVAIKMLPRAFASDPDRLARFNREARMLASLNHPHVGAIYGVEQSEGAPVLILELVEGPTLADRLATGPIPLTESLGIARQIAKALEAAHARGIVHRDLKPANIKIATDGIVKVLDFGVGKAVASDGAAGDLSQQPPVATGDTRDGVILGTPSYMSPEQARGLPVDNQTDIWAFGCVLYEMLTRQPAFGGDTPTDVLAAVVTSEPDWARLPAGTPALIRTLLRRCLARDRQRRFASAADARLEIDGALRAPAAEMPVRAAVDTLAGPGAAPRRVPRLAGKWAGGALVTTTVAWLVTRPAPLPHTVSSQFVIVTQPARSLNVSSSDRDIALSPDGRHIVYRAGGSTTAGSPLMLRAIGQVDARPIANIKAAYAPFFSPDGQWVGFFEGTEIKKAPIAGGPVVTLGAFSGASLGGSWGEDSTIVFATDDPSTGLWRVPANGGPPTVLTTPDAALLESDHAFPSVLPGGRHILFTIAAADQAGSAQVAVLDMETGQRKTLVRGASQAEYVDHSGSGQGGYLILAMSGMLRAAPFDPVRLNVRGDPVTFVERVMVKPGGAANYAVSRLGTLVYVPDGAASATPKSSLVWLDRKGREEPIGAPVRSYGPPRLSPDGGRVAVGIVDQGNTEIWIWDLARETFRRLTFSPGMDGLPLWTPDGRSIIFMSARGGPLNLYSQAVDGGAVHRLTTSANLQWPTSITRDGTRLFGFETGPKTTRNVIEVDMTPANQDATSSRSKAAPLVQKLFHGSFAEVSPDGRYVAYQSDDTGPLEVHVRPFPQVDGGRWQISTGGGTRPAWSRNGRELFYLDASMTLTAVPVRTSGATLSMGRPAKVFDARHVQPNPARHYDVSPDGQRFLMLKASAVDPNATPASMVVVLNWFEELKARAR